ncbi:heavy metal translocating P-type ATPase [Armatimonas rosea]|uniref:Cd2+/Zn2+-exporting ATPase n=1 Tax=Armatimonas rosea TaxID=685828 RepID=A0A7W9STC9_ARMRO|nr:heavy metal translocating P-type ATPase [Armatimonas rosea]MBB6052030.1 Cd2+/Zn2+-exporting ATPase [Armatimonas rosea]
MAISRYFIAAMDCPTEEQLIRNRLKTVTGIEALQFDLIERILTVTHTDDAKSTAESALAELGMHAKPLTAENEGTLQVAPALPRAKLIRLVAAGVLAASAEGLAWALEGSGQAHADNALPVVVLAVGSLLLSGAETARKAWMALRTRTLNINFLMGLAIVGAVVIRQWPEAAMASVLFTVAEVIEGLSLERARKAVQGLMEAAPETVEVLSDCGSFHESKLALVRVGDRVRVRPGQSIPLDGTVTEGLSAVNQAAITGESLPMEKKPGDAIFAGTRNTTGTFIFEVTAARGDTTMDRIVAAVKEAQQERAPTQRFIDKFAQVYTPTVVMLALLYAVLPPLFLGAGWAEQLHRALVMLVIACPCALVISTPVTIVSGLTAAARLGLLVRGGAYLEEGRNLRTIAFDKTGTLTKGQPAVTDILPLTDRAPAELLHLAASLDAASEHPVAEAIVTHCAQTHDCQHLPVEAFEAVVGRGVAGTLGGRRHYVGNHRLTEENQVCGPHVEALLARLEGEGKTTVVLTDAQQALAVIGVADTVRSTAIEAVAQLKALGVAVVMLTGDSHAAAAEIARQAGITDVRAELLPEDKLSAVTALAQQGGGVGMVGDGINDGPALARAQVGFAMGRTGTGVALEIADVALLREDLRLIPAFIRLSRMVSQTLTQNITVALGLKLVFFILALLGKATLPMAVFADVGGSLLVTLNGLRVLRMGKLPPSSISGG